MNEATITNGDMIIISVGVENMPSPAIKKYMTSIRRAWRKSFSDAQVDVTLVFVPSRHIATTEITTIIHIDR